MTRIDDPLALADWRRRVAELYAEVRRADDPAIAWRHWREVRDSLIRGHSQSPLTREQRRRFTALPFFAYDPAYRFAVAVEAPADDTPQSWEIGGDGTITLQPCGRTRGLGASLGGELTLFWITGYGGGLFLPFADGGSGKVSYAGGRYLLDGIKGADLGTDAEGRVILDFNFAYNPSCAYADTWTCPLPPTDNRLPQPIRAGERTPATACEETRLSL